MNRYQKIQLFKQANSCILNKDIIAKANLELGKAFYFGMHGFPNSIVRAKMHFLKAAIMGDDIAPWAYIRKIDMDQRIKCHSEFNDGCNYKFFDAWDDIQLDPNSRNALQKEILCQRLNDLHQKNPDCSQYEKELFHPSTLKGIVLNYMIKHHALFSNQQINNLPTDLQSELTIEDEKKLKRK